jgi:hypothetical protein
MPFFSMSDILGGIVSTSVWGAGKSRKVIGSLVVVKHVEEKREILLRDTMLKYESLILAQTCTSSFYVLSP